MPILIAEISTVTLFCVSRSWYADTASAELTTITAQLSESQSQLIFKRQCSQLSNTGKLCLKRFETFFYLSLSSPPPPLHSQIIVGLICKNNENLNIVEQNMLYLQDHIV